MTEDVRAIRRWLAVWFTFATVAMVVMVGTADPKQFLLSREWVYGLCTVVSVITQSTAVYYWVTGSKRGDDTTKEERDA